MSKITHQPLKGFRDFLPAEARKRQFVMEIIKKTFESYNFEPLETPALEYKELLVGKYGDEADKLIYSFKDQGDRDVALRYDQTVPTARVIASNYQNIPIPWRRYQMQYAWRAEKPQKGRFREILQCDADIYGSTSFIADAELISLINKLFSNLGFTDFKIYINDRKILYDLMNFSNISPDLQFSVIASIDKLDRKTQNEVEKELSEKGITTETISHLFEHIRTIKPTQNLENVINFSKSLGVEEERLIFQSRLARGLDYYTGTIFEVKINGYEAGSVLGGGRYDKLIQNLCGVDIPAVGFALGFDRTVEALEQFKLLPDFSDKQTVLVSIFDPDLADESAIVVQNLRNQGIISELYPDNLTKLEKQLKYADKKGFKWFIVIGPDEVKKNCVILKNLVTGEQKDVSLKDLADKIKH